MNDLYADVLVNASVENARVNVEAFCRDLKHYFFAAHTSVAHIDPYEWGTGWWRFNVTVGFGRRLFGKKPHELFHIDMPGLPLDQVRYLRPTQEDIFSEQSIFDFPRIFIDGNSWVWYYALCAVLPHSG